MEQLQTNLEHSSGNNSIIVNELRPISNKMISSSPSIDEKRSKQPNIKSANHRAKFLSKLHLPNQQPNTPQDSVYESQNNSSNSRKRIVPSIFSPFKPKRTSIDKISIGENKLKEIIQDLNENPNERDAFKEETTPMTGPWKWIRQSRRFLTHWMEKPKFHYTIIILIISDLIIVFIDLVLAQLSLPCFSEEEMEHYNVTHQREDCLLPHTHSLEAGESALYYLSLILISVFVLEIFTAFYAFGWRRYLKLLYLIDAIVVLISFVLEVYFHFGNIGRAGRAAAGIVVLRLWKIVRAIHAIAHSISIRNHLIIEEIEKARAILNEEKRQAEQIINKQQIEIDDLMNLLKKAEQQTTSEQNNEYARTRSKTLDSITLF